MEKDTIDQIVGASFENLDTEDMEQVQGAGDVDAETAAISIICKDSGIPKILTGPIISIYA